jgi:hypothetical protein
MMAFYPSLRSIKLITICYDVLIDMFTSNSPMIKSNKKTVKVAWAGILSSILMLSSSSIAVAGEKSDTYKLRIDSKSSASTDTWSLSGSEANEEWAVIRVKDGREFKIYHSTLLVNKTWGTRQWFDHPVTAMKVCLTDGFEKKDCQVVESDTMKMPKGMSIHNLSIDFKYSESGRSFTKNVTVAKDAKPE